MTAYLNKLYYNNAEWTLASDDDKPLPNVLNINNYIEKALKNIYEGNKSMVNKEFFTIANTILQESISEVEREAGTNFIQKNKEFLRQLRYNTGVFAAFKAHDQTKRVAKELFDENGKLRTFSKFKKATEDITTHHNKLWLRTEYNTAVRSARMGANWKRFEKTKHIYPNLEYMPSRSATPREAHRALWGTIRPIDDAFWATYMPPSAWNCKCSVRATRKEPTEIPNDAPKIPVEFQFNPGQTAQTFRTKKHPYYKNTEKKKEVGKWYDKEYESELRALYKEKYGKDWKQGYKLAETIGIPENYSLDKKINLIAKEIKTAPNELVFVLDKKGKITGLASGIKNICEFDIDIKDKIVIHNHPSGLPFSYNGKIANSDIKIMIDNKADTFIVATLDRIYSITNIKTNLNNFNNAKINNHKQALKYALQFDNDNELDRIYLEKLFELCAKSLNFDFKITKND